MPNFDVNLDIAIKQVGNIGQAINKNIKITVDAPTLQQASDMAIKQLISIRVVRVALSDPATESEITPLQVP